MNEPSKCMVRIGAKQNKTRQKIHTDRVSALHAHCTHTVSCIAFQIQCKMDNSKCVHVEQQKRPHGKCNIECVLCVCVCVYERMKRACLDWNSLKKQEKNMRAGTQKQQQNADCKYNAATIYFGWVWELCPRVRAYTLLPCIYEAEDRTTDTHTFTRTHSHEHTLAMLCVAKTSGEFAPWMCVSHTHSVCLYAFVCLFASKKCQSQTYIERDVRFNSIFIRS